MHNYTYLKFKVDTFTIIILHQNFLHLINVECLMFYIQNFPPVGSMEHAFSKVKGYLVHFSLKKKKKEVLIKICIGTILGAVFFHLCIAKLVIRSDTAA